MGEGRNNSHRKRKVGGALPVARRKEEEEEECVTQRRRDMKDAVRFPSTYFLFTVGWMVRTEHGPGYPITTLPDAPSSSRQEKERERENSRGDRQR